MYWKGLPGTKTLAHYEHSQIMVVKIFITLCPGLCSIQAGDQIAKLTVKIIDFKN
jgi:multisubunit Na+/H+ antiporter MnhE subunit